MCSLAEPRWLWSLTHGVLVCTLKEVFALGDLASDDEADGEWRAPRDGILSGRATPAALFLDDEASGESGEGGGDRATETEGAQRSEDARKAAAALLAEEAEGSGGGGANWLHADDDEAASTDGETEAASTQAGSAVAGSTLRTGASLLAGTTGGGAASEAAVPAGEAISRRTRSRYQLDDNIDTLADMLLPEADAQVHTFDDDDIYAFFLDGTMAGGDDFGDLLPGEEESDEDDDYLADLDGLEELFADVPAREFDTRLRRRTSQQNTPAKGEPSEEEAALGKGKGRGRKAQGDGKRPRKRQRGGSVARSLSAFGPFAAPGQVPMMPMSAPGGMMMPMAMPSPMPGAMPGVVPGAMPGTVPGAMPGAVPGVMPGAVPGVMPAGMTFQTVWMQGPGGVPQLVAMPVMPMQSQQASQMPPPQTQKQKRRAKVAQKQLLQPTPLASMPGSALPAMMLATALPGTSTPATIPPSPTAAIPPAATEVLDSVAVDATNLEDEPKAMRQDAYGDGAMTTQQMAQLYCQMTEHVQLLCQTAVLAKRTPEWEDHGEAAGACEDMLRALVSRREATRMAVRTGARKAPPSACYRGYSSTRPSPLPPPRKRGKKAGEGKENAAGQPAAAGDDSMEQDDASALAPWAPPVEAPGKGTLDVPLLAKVPKLLAALKEGAADSSHALVQSAPGVKVTFASVAAARARWLAADARAAAKSFPVMRLVPGRRQALPSQPLSPEEGRYALQLGLARPQDRAALAPMLELCNPHLMVLPSAAMALLSWTWMPSQDACLALGIRRCGRSHHADVAARLLPCKSGAQVMSRLKYIARKASSSQQQSLVAMELDRRDQPLTREEIQTAEVGLKLYGVDWRAISIHLLQRRDPSSLRTHFWNAMAVGATSAWAKHVVEASQQHKTRKAKRQSWRRRHAPGEEGSGSAASAPAVTINSALLTNDGGKLEGMEPAAPWAPQPLAAAPSAPSAQASALASAGAGGMSVPPVMAPVPAVQPAASGAEPVSAPKPVPAAVCDFSYARSRLNKQQHDERNALLDKIRALSQKDYETCIRNRRNVKGLEAKLRRLEQRKKKEDALASKAAMHARQEAAKRATAEGEAHRRAAQTAPIVLEPRPSDGAARARGEFTLAYEAPACDELGDSSDDGDDGDDELQYAGLSLAATPLPPPLAAPPAFVAPAGENDWARDDLTWSDDDDGEDERAASDVHHSSMCTDSDDENGMEGDEVEQAARTLPSDATPSAPSVSAPPAARAAAVVGPGAPSGPLDAAQPEGVAPQATTAPAGASEWAREHDLCVVRGAGDWAQVAAQCGCGKAQALARFRELALRLLSPEMAAQAADNPSDQLKQLMVLML